MGATAVPSQAAFVAPAALPLPAAANAALRAGPVGQRIRTAAYEARGAASAGKGYPGAGTAALGAAAFAAASASLRRPAAAHRRGGRGAAVVRTRCSAKSKQQDCEFPQLASLLNLGASPQEKALTVNLDPNFYGSFAEIGAGQEVSRTFLTAGAAAGTVARSLSAYDMKMSDACYGKSARYVTKERLMQMLEIEYDTVEETLREDKGPECQFFAFASTLAAKAFNSDRECEGWLGLRYQVEPGAEPSNVTMHVRMSDDTAQKQTVAIGVLGTNMIYLCHFLKNPYLITAYMLDGLEVNEGVNRGRIEVDCLEFSGPAFPESKVDPRLIAQHMIQHRLANGVLLIPNENGKYEQVSPNTALYKRPVVVERSRFAPATNMHVGVMEACALKLLQQAGEGDRPPMKVANMQVDDITVPVPHLDTKARLRNLLELSAGHTNGNCRMNFAKFKSLVDDRLSEEEATALFRELDIDNAGTICVDVLTSVTGNENNPLNSEFLDRFAMLEELGYPVLVSDIRLTHRLVDYLSRYTKEDIVIAVGGGSYSIQRALFSDKLYKFVPGGMLENVGRLFDGTAKMVIYPSIDSNGDVKESTVFGEEQALYEYLVSKGHIVPLGEDDIPPECRDPKYSLSSQEVQDMIREGDDSGDDWEKYVPAEVSEAAKTRPWYARLRQGSTYSDITYRFLNDL